ncbi:MAG: NADH-quinone oxidoreductase subunit NuoE [Thermodesulfobacteriota bacterium]|nr:NADH-quinone oxidoreductase subunit NuoE [Thermodesulfobacteriota bacterium]
MEKEKLSFEEKEKLQKIIPQYQGLKWGLIPLLQRVQEDLGYIPRGAIRSIADALDLFPSQVQGVITFYAQFSMDPRGRNIVRVCRGTACHVRGGRTILKVVKQNLQIEEGKTTEDFKFTLETVACLGTCFLAPVMMVNRSYFGKLVPPKVQSIIRQYD